MKFVRNYESYIFLTMIELFEVILKLSLEGTLWSWDFFFFLDYKKKSMKIFSSYLKNGQVPYLNLNCDPSIWKDEALGNILSST